MDIDYDSTHRRSKPVSLFYGLHQNNNDFKIYIRS